MIMFRAFSSKKGYSLSPEKDNEEVFGKSVGPGLPSRIITIPLDVYRASHNMTVLMVAQLPHQFMKHCNCSMFS